MATITKQDIVKHILKSCADNASFQKDAKQNKKDIKLSTKTFVDSVFEEICHVLESGENIKLSGFGNFELRNKSPRPGRNPKTGELVPITARRVVVFKPGQKLRKKVEQTKV